MTPLLPRTELSTGPRSISWPCVIVAALCAVLLFLAIAASVASSLPSRSRVEPASWLALCDAHGKYCSIDRKE
jgi:hypothetical protein